MDTSLSRQTLTYRYVILHCACCPGHRDGSLIAHSKAWRNLIPSLVVIGQGRIFCSRLGWSSHRKRGSGPWWRPGRQAPCHFTLRSLWYSSSHAMKVTIISQPLKMTTVPVFLMGNNDIRRKIREVISSSNFSWSREEK